MPGLRGVDDAATACDQRHVAALHRQGDRRLGRYKLPGLQAFRGQAPGLHPRAPGESPRRRDPHETSASTRPSTIHRPRVARTAESQRKGWEHRRPRGATRSESEHGEHGQGATFPGASTAVGCRPRWSEGRTPRRPRPSKTVGSLLPSTTGRRQPRRRVPLSPPDPPRRDHDQGRRLRDPPGGGELDECRQIAEQLLAAGWRRTARCHPQERAEPHDALRTIRLYPPSTDAFFLEMLAFPDAGQREAMTWIPCQLSDGWYVLLPHNFHRFEDLKLRTSETSSNRWRRRWTRSEMSNGCHAA